MADRQVTRTGKDRDGDILKLCGPWGVANKAEAIRHIETRAHRYYVGRGTNPVWVIVVNGPHGKHLRSSPDGGVSNNLDSLPDC